MQTIDEYKQRVKAVAAKFADCRYAFDIDAMHARDAELDKQMQSPDFYNDVKAAAQTGAESKYIKDRLTQLKQYATALDDLDVTIELIEQENEDSLMGELDEGLTRLEKDVDALFLVTLLKGDYDNRNAILMLQAGAGGTEAQDWVSMLYRMYRMYAENNGFSIEEHDLLPGDVAGIKSVSFSVKGMNAYGYLKAEKGVHRLVRISPFDSNARRHTSFASLEVMPEIEQDNKVEVRPEDLKVDTYRSGGAGGQHVNKTDSAVRITHLPTGIVVQCQNERSQIQNRETAMKMLLSKLVERKISENLEKEQSIKGDIKKIEWGSQIRSYVFQPYTLVKDHRTGYEDSDVQSVMDGEIEGFIFDYLRKS